MNVHGMGLEQFQVINKILAQERFSRRLFESSEEAIALLDPYLNQLISSLKTKPDMQAENKDLNQLEIYNNIFQTFKAVRPLVRSKESLQELIADGVETTLASFGQYLSSQESRGQNTDVHEVESLIKINKSILDTIKS